MPVEIAKRDYSLMGSETKLAEERGLAGAQWYAAPIPRKRMKELMQRRNGPAIRHTLLWFSLLIITGGLGYYTWGTWWCVPAFMAYGVLYGSVSDSRWHECGHGTAFKTPWMNDVVYQIASFHGAAAAHAMALEPHAPSHRYHHCGARSGNRRSPPSRPLGYRPEILQLEERADESSEK